MEEDWRALPLPPEPMQVTRLERLFQVEGTLRVLAPVVVTYCRCVYAIG
jgi:hypothetical protein